MFKNILILLLVAVLGYSLWARPFHRVLHLDLEHDRTYESWPYESCWDESQLRDFGAFALMSTGPVRPDAADKLIPIQAMIERGGCVCVHYKELGVDCMLIASNPTHGEVMLFRSHEEGQQFLKTVGHR